MNLRISSTQRTEEATATQISHCGLEISMVSNRFCINQTCVTEICNARTDASEIHKDLLVNVSLLKTDCVSLRTFKMLKNWNNTNVFNPIVPAVDAVVAAECSPGANSKSNVVDIAMTSALRATVNQR